MKASLEELYLRSLAELALIKQIVSIHANAVELWGRINDMQDINVVLCTAQRHTTTHH